MFFGISHLRRSFRSSSQICCRIWAAGRAVEGGAGEERWCSARENKGTGDAVAVTLCRGTSSSPAGTGSRLRRYCPHVLLLLRSLFPPWCEAAMDGASLSCGKAGAAVEGPCCNWRCRGDSCRR